MINLYFHCSENKYITAGPLQKNIIYNFLFLASDFKAITNNAYSQTLLHLSIYFQGPFLSKLISFIEHTHNQA